MHCRSWVLPEQQQAERLGQLDRSYICVVYKKADLLSGQSRLCGSRECLDDSSLRLLCSHLSLCGNFCRRRHLIDCRLCLLSSRFDRRSHFRRRNLDALDSFSSLFYDSIFRRNDGLSWPIQVPVCLERRGCRSRGNCGLVDPRFRKVLSSLHDAAQAGRNRAREAGHGARSCRGGFSSHVRRRTEGSRPGGDAKRGRRTCDRLLLKHRRGRGRGLGGRAVDVVQVSAPVALARVLVGRLPAAIDDKFVQHFSAPGDLDGPFEAVRALGETNGGRPLLPKLALGDGRKGAAGRTLSKVPVTITSDASVRGLACSC